MPGPLEIQKKKPQTQHDVFFNKKIVAPQKLKILVLSGNDIVSDELEFIHRCVNVVKLDLSNNHITKITPKTRMDTLKKLQILYLHHNKIETVSGMEGVFMIPKLSHLTIRENPIQRLPRIEHLLINMIPTLKILGERVVFVEERSPDFFEARNPIMLDIQVAEGWKTKENMEQQYIKILQFQLKYFDNIWHYSNPIVVIQRRWRKSLAIKRQQKKYMRANKKYEEISQQLQPSVSKQNLILKEYFKEWKKYARNLALVKSQLRDTESYPEDKTYLTLPLKQYQLQMRNLRVNKVLRKFIDKIRHNIFIRKMSAKIYRQLKRKHIQFSEAQSFYHLSSISTTHRFYFSRIQGHLLQNFLIHMGQNFNWRERVHNTTSTGCVHNYLSIRLVDPETYAVKTVYSTLTYMMWPSMRVVFLKKKNYQSKQRTGIIKIKPLTYIKNQNKILTKQQRKKSIKTYKQLQKFYKKEYENSLDYFQCQDQQIMKMLIRYIYYHNTKTFTFEKKTNKNDMQSLLENYQEPFMIYTDNILQRTAAAVRIQQNWRKFLVRKNQQTSIYEEMKKTRAILRIQRFWRDRVFYHRFSFQKSMSHELKLFLSNIILIKKSIYMNINELLNQNNKIPLYKKLTIHCHYNKQTLWTSWRMRKDTISPYVRKNYFNNRQINYEGSMEGDGYSVLHSGAQVVEVDLNSEKYLQFMFKSIQECRNRIFILALASYRIYGSKKFMPLSKETMDFLTIRQAEYVSLGIMKPNTDQLSSSKLRGFTDRSIQKLAVIKKYQPTGLFISSSIYSQYIEKIKGERVVHQNEVQFYQKIYQDFPKKYIATLQYYIPSMSQAEKNVKEQALNRLIKEHQIKEEEEEDFVNMIKTQFKAPDNSILTVNKIDRKRLSFYDSGGKIGIGATNDKKRDTGNLSEPDCLAKRQKINKDKVQGSQKRKEILDRKNQNLRKIRQDLQKQKTMNSTMRNIKDIQHTETLKKKVSKVKQLKERMKKVRNSDATEEDFIQQGNFVMEQQLKMVIMRSRLQSIGAKPKDRSESISSKRKNSAFSRSFYTEQKNDEKKLLEEQNTKAVNSLGATLNVKIPTSQKVQGDERQIINTRNHRRSKGHSIGAYLRDPSYVHGVFPEQYYPIETKGATFKFFPPL